MYSAYIPVTLEVIQCYDLKKLYKVVVATGIDLIRNNGLITKYAGRIVIENDETGEEIASIHFGQSLSERGTDYSSVRVRAYCGKHNTHEEHWYTVRQFAL